MPVYGSTTLILLPYTRAPPPPPRLRQHTDGCIISQLWLQMMPPRETHTPQLASQGVGWFWLVRVCVREAIEKRKKKKGGACMQTRRLGGKGSTRCHWSTQRRWHFERTATVPKPRSASTALRPPGGSREQEIVRWKTEPCYVPDQTWVNYGPGATRGPSNFLSRPTEFEGIIWIVSKW